MMRAPGPRFLLLAVLLAAPTAPLAHGQDGSPDAGLAAYRSHLENLQTVVADCRTQRTSNACSASRVGSDDTVQWRSGSSVAPRAIRYDWLRETLSRAGKKEDPPKPATAPAKNPGTGPVTPVTVDSLLEQAQRRLRDDWKQAGGVAAQQPDYTAERRSIASILSRREYQGAKQTSPWEQFLEWLENLLARIFGRLFVLGAASPWIVRFLEILLIGALCVTLVWALVRLERRSRLRLIPDVLPAPGAPSARQWQLWFQDAQQMAAQSRWREAIHLLYWAAISRLESKRLWPADRARTPREYLRLFPAADPRRGDLTGLTRSFEKTWYGVREAGPEDFNAALRMAAGLGVE